MGSTSSTPEVAGSDGGEVPVQVQFSEKLVQQIVGPSKNQRGKQQQQQQQQQPSPPKQQATPTPDPRRNNINGKETGSSNFTTDNQATSPSPPPSTSNKPLSTPLESSQPNPAKDVNQIELQTANQTQEMVNHLQTKLFEIQKRKEVEKENRLKETTCIHLQGKVLECFQKQNPWNCLKHVQNYEECVNKCVDDSF